MSSPEPQSLGNYLSPKPYSKEGCAFCDQLTFGRQYRGRLREYRTSDGSTIPWVDPATKIRLTRTVDFIADTGQVFRGNEITHSQRVHDVISNSENLIAFTVSSTGMKRYVLFQYDSIKDSIMRKVQANKNLTADEIAGDITAIDDVTIIQEVLLSLRTYLPPDRIQRIVYSVARNPKNARLIKESKKYICEICGRTPFIQKNGKPYAEADHIEPLGGDHNGLDTPENMRCLCAQCHAVITHGSNEAIEALLRSTVWDS